MYFIFQNENTFPNGRGQFVLAWNGIRSKMCWNGCDVQSLCSTTGVGAQWADWRCHQLSRDFQWEKDSFLFPSVSIVYEFSCRCSWCPKPHFPMDLEEEDGWCSRSVKRISLKTPLPLGRILGTLPQTRPNPANKLRPNGRKELGPFRSLTTPSF